MNMYKKCKTYLEVRYEHKFIHKNAKILKKYVHENVKRNKNMYIKVLNLPCLLYKMKTWKEMFRKNCKA